MRNPTTYFSASAVPIHEPRKGDQVTLQDTSATSPFSRSKSGWILGGIVCLLLLALYLRIGIKLVKDWYSIPDNSHGLLIPFFVLAVLWYKREDLKKAPLRPSWMGLTCVIPGLCLLLLGVFGADLFLSRTSFVLLIAGLVWTLLGSAVLRQLRFVLFVMLLAIPLPALLFNHITFPLQLLSSRLASALLPLAGVPVLRDGNIIQLATMKLEVAEACSGIRSLTSLFTVAVIYGFFLETSVARRWILAFLSIPIAVIANALRILGTGLCVQYWDPDKAVGFFHEFSGWLMFLVSLAILYLVHSLLQQTQRKKLVVAA